MHISSEPRQDTDVFQFTYRILKKNIRDPWTRVMRSRVMATGLKSESQLESGKQGEIAARETCHSSISTLNHLSFSQRDRG